MSNYSIFIQEQTRDTKGHCAVKIHKMRSNPSCPRWIFRYPIASCPAHEIPYTTLYDRVVGDVVGDQEGALQK